MYPYLTGSASWLLLTMLSELFGVQGKMGDLVLEPKLPQDLFDAEGKASVSTQFANRRLMITYVNPQRLEYGDYVIVTIKIEGDGIPSVQNRSSAILSREQIASLSQEDDHEIVVELGAFLP
jgi:cellobiose phosphorylase